MELLSIIRTLLVEFIMEKNLKSNAANDYQNGNTALMVAVKAGQSGTAQQRS